MDVLLAGERPPSEEETIAPLVMKQNCWGGVISYVAEDRRFEVEEALCADGIFYPLEFDDGLHVIEKRIVRYPLDLSR
jgi:hypothetical protein